MRIAIVTGASSGIGQAFIKEIVSSDKFFDSIWVIARRTERLNSLIEKYPRATIVPIQADLTKDSDIEAISEKLFEEKPEVELLINCAGMGKRGLVEDHSKEALSQTIDINCNSLSTLTRVCLPYMTDLKLGARIINMASSAAFLPQPGFACYAASKAYVLSFSRALSFELAPHKVYVTAVCPGPVDTEFLSKATDNSESKFTGIRALCVVQPDKLVKKALKASAKKRHIYVCGFMQKCLHVASKLVPTSWILGIESIAMPVTKK